MSVYFSSFDRASSIARSNKSLLVESDQPGHCSAVAECPCSVMTVTDSSVRMICATPMIDSFLVPGLTASPVLPCIHYRGSICWMAVCLAGVLVGGFQEVSALALVIVKAAGGSGRCAGARGAASVGGGAIGIVDGDGGIGIVGNHNRFVFIGLNFVSFCLQLKRYGYGRFLTV